jgi:hypothetical protein
MRILAALALTALICGSAAGQAYAPREDPIAPRSLVDSFGKTFGVAELGGVRRLGKLPVEMLKFFEGWAPRWRAADPC